MTSLIGTLLLARDVGAAWGAPQVHELANALNARLQQPVAVSFPDSEESPLLAGFQSLVDSGCQRVVILPLGNLPVPASGLISRSIACARQQWPAIELLIGQPLNWLDWSHFLGRSCLAAITSRGGAPSESAALVVAACHTDPMVNANLARLAHLMQESGPLEYATHAFLDTLLPEIPQAIQNLQATGFRSLVIAPWLVTDDNDLKLIEATARNVNPRSTVNMRLVRLSLTEAGLVNLLMSHQLSATPLRHVEATGINSTANSSDDSRADVVALRQLEERINAMLPTEYQGRYEQVSTQSMGTAQLKCDADGNVAWNEIWTSFCDLALAGGPPHRGQLLEAVTSEEASKDLVKYQAVVAEIERAIGLVTALPVVTSSTLGWVGVRCDSEEMAVWLMRAIIVENIMVRREKEILYLPAGPQFTIKREIKNVVTAIAKTVHYWSAHLRSRQQQLDRP